MAVRAALWLFGFAVAVFGVRVGVFSVNSLSPAVSAMPGCDVGPEARFWGYQAEYFARCVSALTPDIVDAYRSVLSGPDRALAVAIGGLLILWSMHQRAWLGGLAGLLYALSDIAEGAYLVAALDGDLGSVVPASNLTMAKWIGLVCAILICLRAELSKRRFR